MNDANTNLHTRLDCQDRRTLAPTAAARAAAHTGGCLPGLRGHPFPAGQVGAGCESGALPGAGAAPADAEGPGLGKRPGQSCTSHPWSLVGWAGCKNHRAGRTFHHGQGRPLPLQPVAPSGRHRVATVAEYQLRPRGHGGSVECTGHLTCRKRDGGDRLALLRTPSSRVGLP